MDAYTPESYPSLARWERLGLFSLCCAFCFIGLVVQWRATCLIRRMTDVDVYFRAGWAVRSGRDIYTVSDDNGWHYHYPPLPAILLVPLADPPPEIDRTGSLPFGVSNFIWFLLSVGCLVLAVHWLAHALEQSSADPVLRNEPRYSWRWWALRVWPVFACLPAIGHTLVRGQINFILLLLLCGMLVAILHKRRFQAGLWLAAAICLKVIPAFLLIYPVWRQDGRFLLGSMLGLAVGMGAIPVLVFGPQRTLEMYQEWDLVLRQPALGQGEDQSRAKELIDVTATDSQSFLAVLHNSLYPDRDTRPSRASENVKRTHWLISGGLTLVTLMLAGWRQKSEKREVMLLGALVLIMALSSPVCHLHYFCLGIPLAMALVDKSVTCGPGTQPHRGLVIPIAIYTALGVLPHLPGMELLRDFGLATALALFLWAIGVILLTRREGSSVSLALSGPVSQDFGLRATTTVARARRALHR
jgi:hypothetical protein